MANPQQDFKRRYPRKAFHKKISFVCDGVAECVDGVEIGEGGLSFKSDLILNLNKKMIVNFFITPKDFFSIKVTLQNKLNADGAFVYGVSFDEVSTALKRQIRAHVARTSSILRH